LDFDYRLTPELPKLAWLADFDRDHCRAIIHHGSAVETRPTFFVEGVWDRPFGLGELASTDCVFGSGAVVMDETIVFVPSTSTTDYLYHHLSETCLVVSNSLPLLLAFLGDELDPQFLDYAAINQSIRMGIRDYNPVIPTRKGSVRRIMHMNLEISQREMREIDKPLPPPFSTFEDYKGYLVSKLERVFANARDPDRTEPMAVLSTQSKGYDSTAINAIAAPIGVDRAFTVSQGKKIGLSADKDRAHQVDDDGTEICHRLGIPCTAIDRRAFESRFTYETELYSTLDDNTDANFLQIFERINQISVLLAGTLGEIWYDSKTYEASGFRMSSDYVRGDLGNHGLAEVRLIVGFVLVTPIYLGACQREDINRITESPAMDPWRLGTSYDRPIPRRLAEEAGVPREAFGQIKMASVVEFSKPHTPWNRDLRDDYFRFLGSNRLLPRWMCRLFPLVQWLNWMILVTSPSRYNYIYYLQRIVSKVQGRDYRVPAIWKRLDGSIYCFCVNRRVQAFRERWLHMTPLDDSP
jgi:hypothetical protein